MHAKPDTHNIQKLVAQGYDFHAVAHLVLRVRDAAAARSFVAELARGGDVAGAADDRASIAARAASGQLPLSLGLTYPGLQALGLCERYRYLLQRHAPAFAQGAAARAAQHLGDTGSSASPHWEAWSNERQAHVLLSVHADSREAIQHRLDALRAKARGAFDASAWDAVQHGAHLSLHDADRKRRRVHFGFLDGLSNPCFRDIGPAHRAGPGGIVHAPGELVLGHANDSGSNPWQLAWEPPAFAPAREFGDAPEQAGLAAFFRDASFGVLRKIEQDEQAFRDWVQTWVKRKSDAGDQARWTAFLRAKLLGRWDNGCVLQPGHTHSPAHPDPDLNRFDFSDDPLGQGCPFGAHIRRMNPRADAVVPARPRPLLRRGMPYGPAYEDQPLERRGLLGHFFCADIEAQFEHLLGQWADMNPMGTPSENQSKDPLIGHHENPRSVFDIPMAGQASIKLDGLSPFVRTRGTLYAFYPGLLTLRRFDTPGFAAFRAY